MLYELGNGQGDVAQLRRLLGDVLPSSSSIDDYEIEGASSPRLRPLAPPYACGGAFLVMWHRSGAR
jgi:hypothetical protein